MADHFASQGYSFKKQTQRSNDTTIIPCIFLSPPTEVPPAARCHTKLKIASFFQILAGIGQGMGAGNIFNE